MLKKKSIHNWFEKSKLMYPYIPCLVKDFIFIDTGFLVLDSITGKNRINLKHEKYLVESNQKC